MHKRIYLGNPQTLISEKLMKKPSIQKSPKNISGYFWELSIKTIYPAIVGNCSKNISGCVWELFNKSIRLFWGTLKKTYIRGSEGTSDRFQQIAE